MSFLVDDDAQDETLQLALAFIDACDGSNSSDASYTSSSSSSSRPASPFSTDSGDGSSATTASSSSKKDSTSERKATARNKQSDAVMRSRAKKKAEAQQLREQVVQLEAMLQQLQGQHTWRAGSSSSQIPTFTGDSSLPLAKIGPRAVAASLWREIATLQARERHKSQLLNTKLKDAVDKQATHVKSLEAMLSKLTNQFEIDLLREDQKQFLYNSSVLSQEPMILAELRQRVQKMHVDIDWLFKQQAWTEIADSVVCSSRLTLDPVVGPLVELRMNVPLQCSARDAGNALWRQMMSTSALIQTPEYYFERRLISSFSYQKNYMMLLDGPDGFVKLNGTSYAQRFSDCDQDAYMWASVLFSSKAGEVFHEKGWMVASNANASASTSKATGASSHRGRNKTLFRGFYQVYSESRDNETCPRTKEQREFVLHTLGNKTRGFHQQMQNLLMHEFTGFQVGSFPVITLMC